MRKIATTTPEQAQIYCYPMDPGQFNLLQLGAEALWANVKDARIAGTVPTRYGEAMVTSLIDSVLDVAASNYGHPIDDPDARKEYRVKVDARDPDQREQRFVVDSIASAITFLTREKLSLTVRASDTSEVRERLDICEAMLKIAEGPAEQSAS